MVPIILAAVLVPAFGLAFYCCRRVARARGVGFPRPGGVGGAGTKYALGLPVTQAPGGGGGKGPGGFNLFGGKYRPMGTMGNGNGASNGMGGMGGGLNKWQQATAVHQWSAKKGGPNGNGGGSQNGNGKAFDGMGGGAIELPERKVLDSFFTDTYGGAGGGSAFANIAMGAMAAGPLGGNDGLLGGGGGGGSGEGEGGATTNPLSASNPLFALAKAARAAQAGALGSGGTAPGPSEVQRCLKALAKGVDTMTKDAERTGETLELITRGNECVKLWDKVMRDMGPTNESVNALEDRSLLFDVMASLNKLEQNAYMNIAVSARDKTKIMDLVTKARDKLKAFEAGGGPGPGLVGGAGGASGGGAGGARRSSMISHVKSVKNALRFANKAKMK